MCVCDVSGAGERRGREWTGGTEAADMGGE